MTVLVAAIVPAATRTSPGAATPSRRLAAFTVSPIAV